MSTVQPRVLYDHILLEAPTQESNFKGGVLSLGYVQKRGPGGFQSPEIVPIPVKCRGRKGVARLS